MSLICITFVWMAAKGNVKQKESSSRQVDGGVGDQRLSLLAFRTHPT